MIVTFLAVLELMKVGKLTVHQDGTFGEIYIEAGNGAGTGEGKEHAQSREHEE